jgi:hypothetical protein
MRRIARAGLLSIVLALTGAALPGSALGAGFVKHQMQYWTWFGPRSWTASESAYGITITNPKSNAVIDYGGSSVLCDGTPTQHFANQRRFFRNGGLKLRNIKLTKVSRIRRDGSTFMQGFHYSGKTGRSGVTGEIVMEYSAYDATYCYQSTVNKGAETKIYRSTIGTLRRIWNSTAYFGPGLPPADDTLV